MSTFISSAVTGKAAAPKAPARRRAAPPAKQPAPLPTPAPTQAGAEISQQQTDVQKAGSVGEVAASQEQQTTSQQPEPTPQTSEPPLEPANDPSPAVGPSPTPTPAPDTTVTSKTAPTPPPVPEEPSNSNAQPLIWREPVTLEQQRAPSAGASTSGTVASNKRAAEATEPQSTQPPAKRTKKSSTRTNAITQAVANNEPISGNRARRDSSVTNPSANIVPTPRVTRARSRAQAEASDVETDTSSRRRKRTPKSVAVIRNSDDESEMPTEADLAAPKRRRKSKKKKLKKKKTGDGEGDENEEEEESESELREIDPNTLSMYDLSRSMKTGKKSDREKKMAEIDWSEVARKRREEADRIAAGEAQAETAKVVETTEGPDGTAEATPAGEEQGEPAQPPPDTESAPPADGVRFRIVNGQIVEDEDTLRIDRQAQAEASAQDTAAAEEENDLTVRHNRGTWVNQRRRDPKERVPAWKSRSDPWTEDETDQFYDALASFGTDFFSISQMFMAKTRHQVKTKFTREERLDPGRINDALLGKRTTRQMNLEEYAQACGRELTAFTKYESYEQARSVFHAELSEKQAQLAEAEKRRKEDERQEGIQREQRKAEAAALRKQNARKGRKGKQQGGTLGGGQAEPAAVEA